MCIRDRNPGLTGLRETLGGLYLDNERYEDAARLLQEALADSPQDSDLGVELGIAYSGGCLLYTSRCV